MTTPAFVNVSRGGKLESAHAIDVAIADTRGTVVKAWGEVERAVFPRSAIKALQALPLVESGAADALSLGDRHLALACASHNGEPSHVEAASSMLAAAGLDQSALECGAHPPRLRRDREALRESGSRPQPLHNNCSGKHGGMLARAVHSQEPTKGYIQPAHPGQSRVAKVLEEVIGVPHDDRNRAIDGCSIPTYAVPLDALAVAFARFGVGEGYSGDRASAARRLRSACFAHPDMVAGSGRVCTAIMSALPGRAFVKTGAEGVYVAAFADLGLGLALKARDGATRAAEVALVALVMRTLELDPAAVPELAQMANPTLTNWNGLEVGAIAFAAP